MSIKKKIIGSYGLSSDMIFRSTPKKTSSAGVRRFQDHLQPLIQGVQFSKHALERMGRRGIELNEEELEQLNDAVSKAASKGSRDSLVLMGSNAFVVGVPSRTVVTAIDGEHLKEQVFTQIDSAVIV